MSKAAIHELKTWPEYFEKLVSGEKNFELRRNDRDYMIGDVLVLREWKPMGFNTVAPNERTGDYTGREVRRKISYVLSNVPVGFGLMNDYCILGLEEYASQPLPVGEDWRQGVEDFWNLCGFDHIADNRYWPQWVGIIEEIIREQTATLQAENTRLEELNKTLHSLMVSGEKRGYEKACQHFQETIGNQEMNLAHLAEENQRLREQLQQAEKWLQHYETKL